MTDLVKEEVVKDKKGNHLRFFSIEDTQAEADAICEKLLEAGYAPATFERTDNHKVEVFTKFTKAEECIYLLEEQFCKKCPPEVKAAKCTKEDCETKNDIDDILWKEQLNFYSLLDYKLKKLRGEALPEAEEPEAKAPEGGVAS